MLLEVPGLTTRNRKLPGAKGIATSFKQRLAVCVFAYVCAFGSVCRLHFACFIVTKHSLARTAPTPVTSHSSSPLHMVVFCRLSIYT